MLRNAIVAFIVLLTFVPATADAQSTAASALPQEVRVVAMNGTTRTGWLISLTDSELTLRQQGGLLQVASRCSSV